MKNLFIAIPCYGCQVFADTARGLIELQAAAATRGVQLLVYFLGNESFIPRARNSCVDAFMKSDYTNFMFIDADVGFKPDDVFALLDSGHDVVCAPYPKKTYNAQRIADAVARGEADPMSFGTQFAINTGADPDVTEETLEAENDCVPISHAATGFLLIRRHVLVTMMASLPETRYVWDGDDGFGEPRWALFDRQIDPKTRRYLTEDYDFSAKWRALGGRIMCYLGANLSHTGTHTFRGNIQSQFRPAPLEGLDATDQVAYDDLMAILNGSYDVPVQEAKTILDVGANIGCFAVWAANRWNGKVTCYEPNPEAFKHLIANCVKDKTICVPKALKDYNGKGVMHKGVNLGCTSFHDLGLQSMHSDFEVDVADAADLPSFDIVKIDTEGDELEILRRLSLKNTKAVMLEYHRQSDVWPIKQNLTAYGFDVKEFPSKAPGIGIIKAVKR